MVRFHRIDVCFIIFEIFVWIHDGVVLGAKAKNSAVLEALALKLPPEIRIIAKNGEYTKTIHDLPNTDAILSPVYFDQNGAGWKKTYPAAADKITKYKSEWVDFIYFECTAFYPVEWQYRGDGLKLGRGSSPDRAVNAHKIISRSLRVSEEFNKTTTSLYFAQISQMNLYEVMTGNYSCRGIENPDTHSFFYVYVPYNSKQGKKDIPLRSFILDNPPPVQVKENSAVLRIPCTVTDPSAQVKLSRKRKDGRFENVALGPTIIYNSKYGFMMNLNRMANPWGYYSCKEESNKTMISVTVLPEKGIIFSAHDEVRVVPNQSHVLMKSEKLEMFECRAKEKIVIMMDVKDVKFNVDYKTSSSHSEKFPYKAVAKIIPSQLRKNFTAVKCIASESQRVLHTWEFSKQGNNTIKITFDARNRQFLCCTESFHAPKFNAVFCGSEIECLIKKGYSFISQNAYSTKHFAPPGCASIPVNIDGYGELRKSITKWPGPVVEGIMQCSVGLVGSETKFETPFFHNQITQFTTFQFGNKTPLGSLVMGIRQEKAPHNKNVGDIYVGDTLRFFCFAPSKYFAVGPTFFTSEINSPPPFYVYQWAVEKINGSLKYLSSEDCFNEFCDITFADKSTTGIVCFAPVRNSPTEFRNFTLSVTIRDRPEMLQTRVLLKNVDEISKVISMKQHNITVVLNETILGNYYEPAIHKIQLECTASYHIQWKYEGSASPYIKAHYIRDASTIKATYSYNYTAILEFVKLEEQSTGRFVCFSTDNPRDFNSYYDIYVPGENLFLSSSDKLINLYSDSPTEKIRLVTIPCAVSDPYARVRLHTVETSNNSWVEAPRKPTMSFDPHRGFVFKKETFDNLLGYYYCGDKLQRASAVVTVQNGKSFPKHEARHAPGWASRRIKNLSFNYSETFLCEANENVTFTFLGEGKPKQISYYMNASSDHPFVATFKADLKDFLNFTQIQCITTGQDIIVHTWKITIEGYFEDRKFYFNETMNSYICCKGMPNPNPMEYVPCASNTECKINKACMHEKRCSHLSDAKFQNSKTEMDIPGLGKGCTSFNINNLPAGLLRCNDEEYFYFQENYEECDFECSSFEEPRYQPFVKSTDVLGITKKPKGKIVQGSPVRFDCFGSKFFFSGGFKWALSDSNGNLEFINGTEKDEGSLIHGWTDMTFPNKNTKAVFCFAPEWNSAKSWKSAIVPIEYLY